MEGGGFRNCLLAFKTDLNIKVPEGTVVFSFYFHRRLVVQMILWKRQQ